MELKDYMALHYPVVIERIEDDGEVFFKASINELPGLVVYGDSFDEVFSDIEEAKEVWFEANISLKRNINLPKTNDLDYSGRMTLRVSKSMHRCLVKEAEEDGVSLNSYINTLIERGRSNSVLEVLSSSIAEINKQFNNFIKNVKPAPQYHFYLEKQTSIVDLYQNIKTYHKV